MLNSAYSIVTEAVKAETSVVSNITESSIINELMSSVEKFDVAPKNIMKYQPEMVNVIEAAGHYYIEIDNIAKLAKDQNMSISEAVFTVADTNSINADNCCVVIESDKSIRDFLEENSSSNSKKSKAAQKLISAINDLNDNNIKVVKSF